MTGVRRWYIYLVCFICLQAVAWAAISLLRGLMIRDWFSAGSAASQISILVVGVPVYLGHWLWAQRLARRDPDERGSAVRGLYLYGAMAALLGPAIANVYSSLQALLRALFRLGPEHPAYRWTLSNADRMAHGVAAIAVLGLLWLYHWLITRRDRQAGMEEGRVGTIRRLYTLGFSAAGLAIVSLAGIGLLRWLLFQWGTQAIATQASLARELARLTVGLAVWLPFWRQAQLRFASSDEEERASVLRKVYLYAAVFIAVMTMVTTATFVLASLFRRALHVVSVSTGTGGDIREAISILVPMAALWAYHAWTLRRDVAIVGEPRAQVRVQQIHRYLVAGIGLAAVLGGLVGLIGFLIRSLSAGYFVDRGSVAWYLAVLVAGGPVWFIPWWRAQKTAASAGPTGDDERSSTVRRIYLYFYLFVATMTVLSSGVYLVAWLIGVILGSRSGGSFLLTMGRPIAYSLMAAGVWLYHGAILRADGRRSQATQVGRLAPLKVVVVDIGDGHLAGSLVDALRRQLPGLPVHPLSLTPKVAELPGSLPEPAEIQALLGNANVIVGPWTMALAGATEGDAAGELARAIAASPAEKLMILTPTDGWQWVGLRRQKEQAVVRDTVHMVRQILTRRQSFCARQGEQAETQ